MSGAAEKLASREEALPSGSLRRRALEGARRFKSAWVEFARLLSEVRKSADWREWGYESFDSYCAKELFIRKQTAEKLTLSYGFLERHEPDLARSRGESKAPPFEVIDVLSRAEASGRLSNESYRAMREELLESPPPPAAANRWLTERVGSPPKPPGLRPQERLERLAALARRLASACEEEERVPDNLAQRAVALAGELEKLLAK
jgi:hypothetical protein